MLQPLDLGVNGLSGWHRGVRAAWTRHQVLVAGCGGNDSGWVRGGLRVYGTARRECGTHDVAGLPV